MTDVTPLERIGGTPAVRRVVDRLYFWVYRDDELYLPYFTRVSLPSLKAHMVSLLSHLLGGREYEGRELISVHAPLNIAERHYDRVTDYVMAALYEEHVPRDIIAAVDERLADLRPLLTHS